MIDDLILRGDALKALGELPCNWNDTPEELQEVSDFMYHFNALGKVPAVDAVPVVRCKNCKMWNTEWSHETGDCYCYKFFQFTDPDFFCAGGERRGNDE